MEIEGSENPRDAAVQPGTQLKTEDQQPGHPPGQYPAVGIFHRGSHSGTHGISQRPSDRSHCAAPASSCARSLVPSVIFKGEGLAYSGVLRGAKAPCGFGLRDSMSQGAYPISVRSTENNYGKLLLVD